LSVSRSTFYRVGFFREDLPQAGVHEDTEWGERFHRLGGQTVFVPRAELEHTDRNTFSEYLKHQYRWGYNSIEVKGRTAVSRFPWLYERPLALVMGALPFAAAQTVYIVRCWLKAGRWEPLLLSPLLATGCLAYASGMFAGGIRTSLKKRQGKRIGNRVRQDR
jgi:GT2 family glycosyltransferase